MRYLQKDFSYTNIYLGHLYEIADIRLSQKIQMQAGVAQLQGLGKSSHDKTAQGRRAPHDWHAPQITHKKLGESYFVV